jgi:hypothetical protein
MLIPYCCTLCPPCDAVELKFGEAPRMSCDSRSWLGSDEPVPEPGSYELCVLACSNDDTQILDLKNLLICRLDSCSFVDVNSY